MKKTQVENNKQGECVRNHIKDFPTVTAFLIVLLLQCGLLITISQPVVCQDMRLSPSGIKGDIASNYKPNELLTTDHSFSGVSATDTTISGTPFKKKPEYHSMLRAALYGTMFFHLREFEGNDPNTIYLLNGEQEKPSVGCFFDDQPGGGGSLTFSFRPSFLDFGNILIGVGYDYHVLMSERYSYEEILGRELRINSFRVHLGMEVPLSGNKETTPVWVGFTLGPTFNSYKGSAMRDGYEYVHTYSSPIGFELCLHGLADNMITKSVFLSVNGGFEFGSVDRGNLEVYDEGRLVDVRTPTGEITLSDYKIFISLTAGYAFNF